MVKNTASLAAGVVSQEDQERYFKNARSHLDTYFRTSPFRDLILGKKSPYQNGILKMDIHPLEKKSDWFRVDSDYAELTGQKKKIIEQYRSEVLAIASEGIEGAHELPWVIGKNLSESFPDLFRLDGSNFINCISGSQTDLKMVRDPLEAAALMTAEDLILIHERSDGRYYLSAGALCFPSAWSLREKLGKNIQEIHSPVPLVNEKLGKAIDRFLAGIRPEQQFWRINFLTTTSGRLSQLKNVPEMMDYRNGQPLNSDNCGKLILRNERETLTRLPKSRDILFTLKTYMTPFDQLSPFAAGQLASLLKALPERSITEYREWSMADFDCVISYLVNRSNQPN